jgi:hypothetical protein
MAFIMENVEYLVFSGGGTRLFSMLGAYTQTLRLFPQITKNLKGCAGASAGSLLSLMIVLGLSPAEILQLCFQIPVHKLFDNLSFNDVKDKWGISNHDITIAYIGDLLLQVTGRRDITFQELFEYTQKELVIMVSRLEDFESIACSHKTTPHFLVWKTIIASCCIPLLFQPVKIDNCTLVDGAILNNLPLEFFPIEKSLCFWLKSQFTLDTSTQITDLGEYLKRVVYMPSLAIEVQKMNSLPPVYWEHIISIGVCEGDDSSLNFTIDNSSKLKSFEDGKLWVYVFCTRHIIWKLLVIFIVLQIKLEINHF